MPPELYQNIHTSALAKVGARIPEAREFILSYNPELTRAQNVDLAFHKRWYGNSSSDVCDKLTTTFISRFDQFPGLLSALRRWLQGSEAASFTLLNHFCMVLADRYYRLAATDFLYQRFQEGRIEVPSSALEQILKLQLPNTYTSATVNRYARNILTALRDNGFLSGQSKKTIISPSIPVRVLAFMLYAMCDVGVGANSFDDSLVFRSLLKPRELFVPVFQEGERLGFWDFTGDRSALRVNLHYCGLKEWLEAIGL